MVSSPIYLITFVVISKLIHIGKSRYCILDSWTKHETFLFPYKIPFLDFHMSKILFLLSFYIFIQTSENFHAAIYLQLYIEKVGCAYVRVWRKHITTNLEFWTARSAVKDEHLGKTRPMQVYIILCILLAVQSLLILCNNTCYLERPPPHHLNKNPQHPRKIYIHLRTDSTKSW